MGSRGIRLFDYPRWAEPLSDELRAHTEGLAAQTGLEIEFIRRHNAFRKEARVKAILREGLLLRAKRAGFILAARPLMIVDSGMYLDADLIAQSLAEVGE